VGHFYLWELCKGNLEGGLPFWGPWRIGKKALEMGISFHRARAGKPGRGLIYQGLGEMDERGSRNGTFLSEEAQCGGFLSWGRRRYVKEIYQERLKTAF
jgi:hypothetical protein